MTEELPTETDLERELADPTVAMLMTPEGKPIRFIRKSEYDRAHVLAHKLINDPPPGFWRK